MTKVNYLAGRTSSGPLVDPDRVTLKSDDGTRIAYGRNVKGESATPGRYEAYRKWRLVDRSSGRAVTVAEYFEEEQTRARAWISG